MSNVKNGTLHAVSNLVLSTACPFIAGPDPVLRLFHILHGGHHTSLDSLALTKGKAPNTLRHRERQKEPTPLPLAGC